MDFKGFFLNTENIKFSSFFFLNERTTDFSSLKDT